MPGTAGTLVLAGLTFIDGAKAMPSEATLLVCRQQAKPDAALLHKLNSLKQTFVQRNSCLGTVVLLASSRRTIRRVFILLIIFIMQIVFVLSAAWIAHLTDLFPWYYSIILAMPLILSASTRFSGMSATLNARVLLPISAGLFFMTLFHYFPELVTNSQADTLAIYGIANSNDGSIDQAFFEANDLFTTSVSVLYAICVAFMLFKGLSDFDELRNALSDEASEINTIVDYMQYFKDSGKNDNWPVLANLLKFFRTYITNIHAGRKIVISKENDIVLRNIIKQLSKLSPKDANDKIALEEIMKGYSRVVGARSRRHSNIQKSMSPFILILVLLMSLSLLASFFGKASGIVSVDYFYVFLLSMFYTSILMTLIDLGSPFDGYWAIKTEAFEGLVKKIEAELQALNLPDQSLFEKGQNGVGKSSRNDIQTSVLGRP